MTPKNEAPAKTNEEMLRAIIEAQAVGGFKRFYPMSGEWKGVKISEWGSVELRETLIGGSLWHILQILLDTDGCKAAYGYQKHKNKSRNYWVCKHCPYSADHDCPAMWETETCSEFIAHEILHAWHSGPGNNIDAAIKTAFDLLPPSR